MGFDQNESKPLIEPRKKTTKVNIAMVIGMAVFLLICAAGIIWMKVRHPS